jgi:hypothetical protein
MGNSQWAIVNGQVNGQESIGNMREAKSICQGTKPLTTDIVYGLSLQKNRRLENRLEFVLLITIT